MDHGMSGMPGMSMDMGEHENGRTMAMSGVLGPYPMSREASGTAWQPDDAEHRGLHMMRGAWTSMLHGSLDLVRDHQRGPRGSDKTFSDNMLMAMARRSLGAGVLGLRAMLSAEPSTIGRDGYPLLLQTGETANGRTPLIDRQHPHDLFMELSSAYSVARGRSSAFIYAGLPGEPALGPPAYMHRFSGMMLPEAPITHHWLDSTHITYGVLTFGVIADRVKLEASAFHGREPDRHRYDIETGPLDSHAFPVSFNPTAAWALQVSHGRLHHPEQLEPTTDQDRTTASASYARDWSAGHVEATLAWGRDINRPGHSLDAFLLEAAAEIEDRHHVFARAEHVAKDELFAAGDPLAGRAFEVGKLSGGYRYDFWHNDHLVTGVGALASVLAVPTVARAAYGERPRALMVFLHAALR